MLPQELIRKKRDGQSLTRDEVQDFIAGLTTGTITEGQVAAFAMAVFFSGMARAGGRGAHPCHAQFRHRSRMG